jgi:hypothetical protein
MSKHFSVMILALPLILQLFNNSPAQDIEITIAVDETLPHAVRLRGKLPDQTASIKSLSLLREYAGTLDVANRVSDVKLEAATGFPVAYSQLIPGEYVAENDFVAWSYTVNLSPIRSPVAAGHISWIGEQDGMLFLRDLLPLFSTKRAAAVTISLPAGWRSSLAADRSIVKDPDAAVVFISKRFRELNVESADVSVQIFLSGTWMFTDAQLSDFAAEVLGQYKNMFGSAPKNVSIFYSPFPFKTGAGTWEGDTRGTNVTIISEDMLFDTPSVQRLHEQLRHELFHLWIPNSLNLTGSYDWFYEGFALYQSLKTGVTLNRLRFSDFLDTLSRAITVDAALNDRRSLLELSTVRHGPGNTLVYARGMSVAFLTDLKLLGSSGGKRDIAAVLRTLFQKHRVKDTAEDGNTAVLNVINLPEITEYVRSGRQIDWANELRPAGLEVITKGGVTTIGVTAKPTSSQRRILDKLGYNNWRKMTVRPK